MDEVLNIYKPLGMTTFQAIEGLKKIKPEYKDIPIAYTGRLDPMAEGVLVFLVGEKRYKAKTFQKMEKEYTAKILFGFSTDSYDLLGLVEKEGYSKITENQLNKYLKKYKGENNLSLPPYCAYRVKGKPMFYLARNNLLKKEDIPKKKMMVYNFGIIKKINLEKRILGNYIFKTISNVRGDFRQKEIIRNWRNVLNVSDLEKFQIFEINFKVSGGTYIRSIVNNISEKMGTPILLYNLKRDKVNGFSSNNSIII